MTTRPGRGLALLVIDLQVGVVRGAFDADGVLARTQLLVERCRAAEVPVVWVQDHQDFASGSPDWELAPPLAPAAGELRVDKGWRDAFVPETGLTAALDTASVGALLITGAQSDFCVRTAGQRAAADGFDVTLVADCHTTTDSVLGAVTVPGREIVAHTAAYFSGLRYPGQRFAVLASDDPDLLEPAQDAVTGGS
jgi:nicotinamidase-related amidase